MTSSQYGTKLDYACWLSYCAIRREPASQVLSMIVYFVFGSAVRKDSDVGIIAICQNAHMLLIESGWKQVGWPESFWLMSSPCMMRVAI